MSKMFYTHCSQAEREQRETTYFRGRGRGRGRRRERGRGRSVHVTKAAVFLDQEPMNVTPGYLPSLLSCTAHDCITFLLENVSKKRTGMRNAHGDEKCSFTEMHKSSWNLKRLKNETLTPND